MEECIECGCIVRVLGKCKFCNKPICGNCIKPHVDFHESIIENKMKWINVIDSSIRSMSEHRPK